MARNGLLYDDVPLGNYHSFMTVMTNLHQCCVREFH